MTRDIGRSARVENDDFERQKDVWRTVKGPENCSSESVFGGVFYAAAWTGEVFYPLQGLQGTVFT